jgi:hypothetical protein
VRMDGLVLWAVGEGKAFSGGFGGYELESLLRGFVRLTLGFYFYCMFTGGFRVGSPSYSTPGSLNRSTVLYVIHTSILHQTHT